MQAFNPDREFFDDAERLGEAVEYLEAIVGKYLKGKKEQADIDAAWAQAAEHAGRTYGFAACNVEAAYDRRFRAWAASRGLDV